MRCVPKFRKLSAAGLDEFVKRGDINTAAPNQHIWVAYPSPRAGLRKAGLLELFGKFVLQATQPRTPLYPAHPALMPSNIRDARCLQLARALFQ
jgi:hypothetical protein